MREVGLVLVVLLLRIILSEDWLDMPRHLRLEVILLLLDGRQNNKLRRVRIEAALLLFQIGEFIFV